MCQPVLGLKCASGSAGANIPNRKGGRKLAIESLKSAPTFVAIGPACSADAAIVEGSKQAFGCSTLYTSTAIKEKMVVPRGAAGFHTRSESSSTGHQRRHEQPRYHSAAKL